MASKGNAAGILSIAVLLAGLTGCATAAQVPPPPPPPPPPPTVGCGAIGNHNIEVGAVVDCKWAPLHSNAKGNGNVVMWRSTVNGKGVKIVFDSSPFETPLQCEGKETVCLSGPLRATISGDPAAPFTYHAWLCDQSGCGNEIDPGIIIVP